MDTEETARRRAKEALALSRRAADLSRTLQRLIAQNNRFFAPSPYDTISHFHLTEICGEVRALGAAAEAAAAESEAAYAATGGDEAVAADNRRLHLENTVLRHVLEVSFPPFPLLLPLSLCDSSLRRVSSVKAASTSPSTPTSAPSSTRSNRFPPSDSSISDVISSVCVCV